MANVLTQNPITIDTFGADVSISQCKIRIAGIYVTALSSDKNVVFIDASANKVLDLRVASGTTAQFTPGKPVEFTNGLIYDDSASSVASNDLITVFID